MAAEEDAHAYYEKVIAPLVEQRYPDLLSQMCVVIDGSHGLGLQDEYSDLDMVIYLGFDTWATRGRKLQLLMQHPPRKWRPRPPFYCQTPDDPFSCD